jgi:hypothetical protein
MADIIQAAKWMNEGRRVTRPDLGYATFAKDEYGFILLNGEDRAYLEIEDVLATDWEIAE